MAPRPRTHEGVGATRSRLLGLPPSLWLIFLVALVLRLTGAWHGNLMYDELGYWACAKTIDFRPDSFNLAWRSVDHPLLSVYVVKVSTMLFGDGNFGSRILHLLVGSLTVFPIFLLGRQVYSEKAGLLAAGLLAVDQFHLTWSYFLVPEVLLLFFATLTLLQFLRAAESRETYRFVLLGLFLGLCYLSKETGTVLVPTLWLIVLCVRQFRSLLLDFRWYLAFAVAGAVVLPDLAWNLSHYYEGYLYRDSELVSSRIRPSPRAMLLFLGELTQHITGPRGGFRTNYATQNPALMHWPAGLLYLGATLMAVREWRRGPVSTLLLVFAVVFFGMTALPSAKGYWLWWWASLTLVPAVVFGGEALRAFLEPREPAATAKRAPPLRRIRGVAVAALLVYLTVHAVGTATRPGVGVARQTPDELVRDTVQLAAAARTPKEIRSQEWSLVRTLHIAGPDADLYAYLARSSLAREEPERARYFIDRSLSLDPDNEVALSVQERLETLEP